MNSSENDFEIEENFQSSTLNESQENDKLLENKETKLQIANETTSMRESDKNDKVPDKNLDILYDSLVKAQSIKARDLYLYSQN